MSPSFFYSSYFWFKFSVFLTCSKLFRACGKVVETIKCFVLSFFYMFKTPHLYSFFTQTKKSFSQGLFCVYADVFVNLSTLSTKSTDPYTVYIKENKYRKISISRDILKATRGVLC